MTRILVIRRKGIEYFNTVFIRKFDNYTIGGLLLTLIILFSFQGETILNNPLHIVLIAVPLVLQTVAISLFGLQSGAALVTVVGVLVEVPVMLMLVRVANNTCSWFTMKSSMSK